MEKENYQMRGQASQDSFYGTKGHLREKHGPGRDLRGNKQPQDPTTYGQWQHMSDAAKSKEKQKWAIVKPMLDNARQLRGIFFIEPEDDQFKHTMKNARRKLEIPMPAAMPCKTPTNCRGETCRNIGKSKTKYACIVDADETMRIRLEGVPHRYHEDHISAKGINSLSHYNLVHKFIPMPQAMKIPAAKAAVVKEWGKQEKIPAWQLTNVRNKREVIEEARNKGRKVHFASSVDLCHLKNSELEPQHQKYKRQSRTPR